MKKVTGQEFQAEVLENSLPVVVDFYADWCGPCKRMAPHLESLSGEMSEQVKVVKVNADEEQELSLKYQVQSLPTLIVFKEGKPVMQRTSALPPDLLKEFLTEASKA